METTVNQNLKQQVLSRLAKMKATALQALGAGPFGTGESREDFEKRIMEDESAWTGLSNKTGSILPRGG